MHCRPNLTPYSVKNDISAENVIESFKKIPANVTSLDLRENHLHRLGANGLRKVLAHIPPSVTSLDLSWNDLYRLGADGLIKVLAHIPPSVTSLDLSVNFFSRLKIDDLKKILSKIPTHIKTIHLDENKLFTGKSAHEKDKILKALRGNRTRFDLTNNGESDLARALAPVAQLTSEKYSNLPILPNDIAAYILSHLSSDSNNYSKQDFFPQQLKKTKASLIRLEETRPKAKAAALTAIQRYLDLTKKQESGGNKFNFFSSNPVVKLQKALEKTSGNPNKAIFAFLLNSNTSKDKTSASFLLEELALVDNSLYNSFKK